MPILRRIQHGITGLKVTDGAGQGGNPIFVANDFSQIALKGVGTDLKNTYEGFPAYLRGFLVKFIFTVNSTPAQQLCDMWRQALDVMIKSIHIQKYGVDMLAPFRMWVRHCEQFSNLKRYLWLEQGLSDDDTDHVAYMYIPLNHPMRTAFLGVFDVPVSTLNENDFLRFNWGSGTGITDHTFTSLECVVFPHIVTKSHLTVPPIMELKHVRKNDETLEIALGTRLITNLNIMNQTLGDAESYAGPEDCNEYDTVGLDVDEEEHIIDRVYPGHLLDTFDFVESDKPQAEVIHAAYALGTSYGGVLPSQRDISIKDIYHDEFIQPVYNVPYRGKLSYALFCQDKITLYLNPPDAYKTSADYHNVMISQLIENKRCTELRQRLNKLKASLPEIPAVAGRTAIENLKLFNEFRIG